ncbi:ATP-binding cassette domain-containing protein [Sporosarcina thermotolerans]|uniref:ATP-binding cassette domain-containing protein n=1 Tax=Sporosarcina thermotolerans TaxID=633404 RepID=A0AAW9A5U7_9BACL|nr:ATP-binding cassette domain-containing protein [Sporosarcina thermotolerans]MDW0116607.1 ATP-binding cassette domain-containing protein [Sporosarcina thermotolerans]
MSLLTVNDLKVHYPIRGGFFRRVVDHVRAVDGISFELQPGETYGLVGESGCGKTTSGRAIIGLNKSTGGEMLFEGKDLAKMGRAERYKHTKDIQMIFQDPYSSLNGRKNVLNIIAEPLRNFERLSPKEELLRVQELVARVGLSPESIYKYPHQFSGGQRQRIGIARALALNPKLIIADEPVSALDVSVQAQVLNFMQEIQEEFNLTYLFISHDLGIIQHMCDRIGIMYRGRFVEEGTADEIYNNPQHVYTKRLIAAIPEMNPEKRFEKMHLRQAINEEYQTGYNNYFDNDGRMFDLKKISDSHSVAMQ